MDAIVRVELSMFRFETPGLGLPSHGAAGVGKLTAQTGARLSARRWAVRIETHEGARGRIRHTLGRHTVLIRAGVDAGAPPARP